MTIDGGEARMGGWRESLRRNRAAATAGFRRAVRALAREVSPPLIRRLTSDGTPRVPAIVLTCDRYQPFATHMIMRYRAVWPSHPFTFHVPYLRCPLGGERVEARQCPEAVRATVLGLLAGFDDETWVYWCIDDKYPIELVQPPVAHLAEAVLSDG